MLRPEGRVSRLGGAGEREGGVTVGRLEQSVITEQTD